MDTTARPAEPVVDVVPQEVPAAGDGEDEARAREEEVAQDRERVLGPEADRVLDVGQIGLGFARARGFLERLASNVVSRILGAENENIVPPGERAVMSRLHRASGRARPVQQAAVGRDQAHVELLRVERPDESVHRHGQALGDLLLAVEDGLVELGLEEVAGGEVAPRMLARVALGQRARLLDPVLTVLIRERGVGSARGQAELAKDA